MPDRPYTDDDLRTEAAHCLSALSISPTAPDIRRSLPDTYIDSHRTPTSGHEATWVGVVGEEGLGVPVGKIQALIEGAADVSEWAIGLGVDGLEPSPEEINLDNSAGAPFVRMHFAFHPDMAIEQQQRFVLGVRQAMANSL